MHNPFNGEKDEKDDFFGEEGKARLHKLETKPYVVARPWAELSAARNKLVTPRGGEKIAGHSGDSQDDALFSSALRRSPQRFVESRDGMRPSTLNMSTLWTLRLPTWIWSRAETQAST